jgi:quercetin dioxygenase-like cupin family protein
MRLVLLPIFLLLTTPLLAQDTIERMTAEEMQSFRADEIVWNDEALLPKGAKSALIVGDPSKAGIFIAWLKFPPNYPIPAHTHPFTEVITVLKGSLGNGMGEQFDKSSGEILNVGESFVLPAGHAHYVWTSEQETIVELIATGPWDISYINPEDDPRN